MYIDFEKIAAATGCRFDSADDLLYFLQNRAEYLATHNKNLTKRQYSAACDLLEMLNCITTK